MTRPIALLFLLLTPLSAGAAVRIQSRIDAGPWSDSPAVSPLAGQRVSLRVKERPGASVRWFQLFPDLADIHKNANHPWEPNAYQWVGFGKVPVYRNEVTALRGKWEFELFKDFTPGDGIDNPTTRSCYYRSDLGSFWFQAEIEKDGRVEQSPGLEASDHRGLSPTVFRVSRRGGPGFLGWVASYFNVPAVFGSVPHQSNHYIGCDCADLLVAARGKWAGVDETINYNVARLVREYPKAAEFDLDGGTPSREIRWGRDARRGDLIAVRYRGARSYQHIGTLAEDKNGNGLLDRFDQVLHAGPMPLMVDILMNGAFDGHVALLRPLPPEPKIIDKPISFSNARKAATRRYLKEHYGIDQDSVKIEPKLVVVHWTAIGTLEGSWKAFDRENLAPGRGDVAQGGNLNVSIHYLIDRDGTIYRLMPDDWMARHVIGLNHCAIGIENVGGVAGLDDLSPEQLDANARLITHLKRRYRAIEGVAGHHEYRKFENGPLWREKDPGYRTEKSDPGDAFMTRLRAALGEPLR